MDAKMNCSRTQNLSRTHERKTVMAISINPAQHGFMLSETLATLLIWVGLVSGLALGQERRLTTDGRLKDSPTFVDRSGQEIAYVVQESPSLMRLMKWKLAECISEPISPNLDKNEFEPAFSRDGSWLASVQSRGNLSMSLVIRHMATGKEVEIKPEGGFCGYRSPTFAADGTRIVYSFAEEDRQSIVSVDREGRNKKRVVHGPGHSNWPNITPDGEQLVFGSSRDGNYEIYASLPDGSSPRRLTDSPNQDVRPRVSPDGRRIAFTSARDGNFEIYVMRLDGTGLVRVTNNPERDDYPAWHPNSKQLVVVSERAGKHDLYLVDCDDQGTP